MKKKFFRQLPLLAAISMLSIAAALPSTAHAILAGAESNAQLVNSTASPEVQRAELDRMKRQGVQVVRVNFGWSEIAANCKGQSLAALRKNTNPCYNWAIADSLVREATKRKMRVMMSTSRVPDWLFPAQCKNTPSLCYFMGRTLFQFNKVNNHYAAFMTAIGTRYRKGSKIGFVQYWTIWNEPNSNYFWKPSPNAKRYAQLYGKAAPALKRANPSAQIAAGPTGPRASKALNYIRTAQVWIPRYLPGKTIKAKRRYIQAWAHNPYPNVTAAPNTPPRKNVPAYIMSMYRIGTLAKTMDRNAVTRKLPIWATEFGWETKPEPINWVTDAKQAQFMAEGFHWLDKTNRVTIGISYGLSDPTDPKDFQSGTFDINGEAKISHFMFQRMISVPTPGGRGIVKRGSTVSLWGKSNVSPRKGVLVYRVGTKGPWKRVKGVRRKADGSMRATMRVTAKTTQFAVYDGVQTVATNKTGYGVIRTIVAR